MDKKIELQGKYFITGTITAVTGLFIGGSNEGLTVGGADLVVVRDIFTNEPYIPGSSLKGKLRCLYEKSQGSSLEIVVGEGKDRKEQVCIHYCKNAKSYANCKICKIFGIGTGSENDIVPEPGRLIVRDSFLDNDIARILKDSPHTDMPYTELKTEVVIDRITSKATPRQLERIPAGSEFAFEMIFNVYDDRDHDMLKEIFLSMHLLENDYLGGQGSRGSGQIKFGQNKRTNSDSVSEVDFNNCVKPIKLVWKSIEEYKGEAKKENDKGSKIEKKIGDAKSVEDIYEKL